eukprot:jgi/Tetstr1/442282/TSEL_030423.t1
MKICVKGPSGMFHALDISGEVLIRELKDELAKVEEIPAQLQVIRFAGQELNDNVPIGEYTVLEYSLQEEVLLYLEQRLAEPMTIFIKCPAGRSDMIMERVEEATTIDEVMDIMVSLQVVAAWAESAEVVVRRTEGSTIKNLGIEKTHTVRETRDIISAAQGFQVEQMLFLEGFDGHLHIQVTPSEEPEDVQQGETLLFSLKHKQPVMPKKDASTGMKYQDFAKSQCLMDRSQDYDPYHTWLPENFRRTNPWPTTGPANPLP